jgi:hypothetical protein
LRLTARERPCLVDNAVSLRAAHVSAQGLSRLRALASSVDADLRRVAACEAATAVLCSIQGNASSSAAVFSLLANIAASAAIVSAEAYVGAYAIAAEVLRPTAGAAAFYFPLLAAPYLTRRDRVVRLMMSPGHPRDRSQNPSEKRLPYQPQRSTPGQAAVGQPLGKLVEGAFPRATAGTLSLGGNFPVSVFGGHPASPFFRSLSQNETGHFISSRLRRWLRPSRAPILGTGFLASTCSVLCCAYHSCGAVADASVGGANFREFQFHALR